MKMCPNEKCEEYRCTVIASKFCPECGTKLVDKPKCGCGADIGKYNKFCSECGRPVK